MESTLFKNLKDKKISFSELVLLMKSKQIKKGVIVFKQDITWKREFSLEERSYIIDNNQYFFDDSKISNALYGVNITGDDHIKLNWYLGKWVIDYCYILEE